MDIRSLVSNFENTIFYDADKFPRICKEKGNYPLTEDNLQLPDHFIIFFRNSKIQMNIIYNRFVNTINTIFESDNYLNKIRTILLLFMFKNNFDIYPYFTMIITEDKLKQSHNGFFDEYEDILMEEGRYFNSIFYNELAKHPALMLNVVESIHQFVTKYTLQYELIYSIIYNLIMTNEDSPTPIFTNQLNFMDESDVFGYKDMINRQYPIILPFSIKYEDYQNEDSPCLEASLVVVDRTNVLETVWTLDSIKDIINSKFKINFLGEEGIDCGGLAREFIDVSFNLITKTETDLFEIRNGYYWFKYHKNKTEQLLNKYRSVGLLFGVALKNKMSIPIRFSRIFYKKLLHRDIFPADLQSFDPELSQRVFSFLDENIDEYDLNFVYSDPLNHYNVDLATFIDFTDNDEHEVEALNDSNKKDFIFKLAEWLFIASIEDEFKAFEQGFTKVSVGDMFYRSFRLDELDLIVSGSIERNWSDLQKAAIYSDDGYDENSQVIVWFWEYFALLEEEKKINVIKFITGTAAPPAHGLKSLHIQFLYSPYTEDLPCAHTCFKQLVLPNYESFEKLKEKCDWAFPYSETFGNA